tara:strand:- start:76 stop:450 length:375 start_codon:yes stop_codon:yes gene_type:complete
MYNIYNKAIKDMKNYWNKCFTSTRVLLLVLLVISSTMLFATIYNNNMESSMDIVPPVEDKDSTQVWIPTKQDIEYQDSMYAIIERTSADVDTIKEAIDHILYKLERIQYVDGTSDSIRYPIKNQ